MEKEFKVEQKRVLNNVEVLGLSEIIQLTMRAEGCIPWEKNRRIGSFNDVPDVS